MSDVQSHSEFYFILFHFKMYKRKQSLIGDFFGETSKCTEPKTLADDDSEAIDASAKHNDTWPPGSKPEQSYEKKLKQDDLSKSADMMKRKSFKHILIRILGVLALTQI